MTRSYLRSNNSINYVINSFFRSENGSSQGCKSGFFTGGGGGGGGGGGIIGQILPKFAISRVWGMIFQLNKNPLKLSNFQFHVPQQF